MKKLLLIIIGIILFTGTYHVAICQQRKRSRYTFKQKKLRPVRKQNRRFSKKNSFVGQMGGVLHMPGAGNLLVGVLAGERTFAAEVSYDHNIRERIFSRTTIAAEWGEVFTIPYRGYYFHHGLGGAVLDIDGRYYLHGLLGVTGVFDNYPASEVLNDRWNLGVHYGLEAEIGILPTLALTVNSRQFIMRNSPNRWLAMVGLKFRLH